MGQSQDKSRTPQATGQTDSASRRAVLAGACGVAAWAMLPGKSFAQKIAKRFEDPARRARFWSSLEHDPQVIATGTSLPESAGWQILRVEKGAIHAQ